ncbi:MAG: dolichyl-phosphate beta-glucosyltransferase [Candidatus Dojkabacteria bacterium]
MKVSIVIPGYNEENRIKKTLPMVINYTKEFEKKFNVETEVIVVNDGSKDRTLEVLKTFGDDIKIVDYSPNMGKGYAVKQGVQEANGDIIYIADADLSTPIEYMEKFYENINDYDCVIGSRALGNEDIKITFLRKLLAKTSNLLIRYTLGLTFKDTQCGFKMFTKEAKKYMLMCRNNRWGYDFEFLYLLQKNGMRIMEMPVKWSAVGESRVKPYAYIGTLRELFNVKRFHK